MCCLLSVVYNIGGSVGHVAMEGTPGGGFNVNRVDLVGGDVLCRLGFEFISMICILVFVNNVWLMMTAGVDMDGI